MINTIHHYINGQLCPSIEGNLLDNIEPATGQVYSQMSAATSADIDFAVEKATAAFPAWSALSQQQRAGYLLTLAQLIEKHSEKLALAESQDTGKPLWLAQQVDIPRAVDNFRFFAQAITQFSSESHAHGDIGLNYTLRQPLGVVACISPWNLPLYLLTWKIAPALAAGNCVIAKPSELTPMSAYLLSELCIEAQLPPGVLNIIHGKGSVAGEALIQHSKIKAISFTGGTKTGQHIATQVGTQLKKLSLELGGKNPAIVFDDCDLEHTVAQLVRASFSNQGQICLCSSRILVQEKIYSAFKEQFVAQTKQLTIDDPNKSSSQQGAINSAQHLQKILNYISLAQQEGGTILTGGQQKQLSGRCKAGYFLEPTVIDGLNNTCRTNQEEIFGPVVTLQPFHDQQEAIKIANDSTYGLSATIWSNNLQRCHQTAKQLDVGIIWINAWMVRDLRTPFGGMKQSGVGREGGIEALRFFTEAKNIYIHY